MKFARKRIARDENFIDVSLPGLSGQSTMMKNQPPEAGMCLRSGPRAAGYPK